MLGKLLARESRLWTYARARSDSVRPAFRARQASGVTTGTARKKTICKPSRSR
jgi:hypothetical protein